MTRKEQDTMAGQSQTQSKQQALTTQTPNGAMQKAAPAPATSLKDWLEKAKDRLATVASKFVTPDELIRLALLAGSRQPQLYECSPESILRSLMDAAQLGIRPGGLNGRGYLVPRMNN